MSEPLGQNLVVNGLLTFGAMLALTRLSRLRGWWWLPALLIVGQVQAVQLSAASGLAAAVWGAVLATGLAAMLQSWLLDRGTAPGRAGIAASAVVAVACVLLLGQAHTADWLGLPPPDAAPRGWVFAAIALANLLLYRAAVRCLPPICAIYLGLLGLLTVAVLRVSLPFDDLPSVSPLLLAMLLPPLVEEHHRHRDETFGLDRFYSRALALALVAASPVWFA